MDLLTLLLNNTILPENKIENNVCFPPTITSTWLAEGVLQLLPQTLPQTSSQRSPQEIPPDTLIISAGIHGNETAPVEILIQIVSQLAQGNLPLQHNLLLVFGNLPAMREGKRYLDHDLNRLFGGRYQHVPLATESNRAKVLESVIRQFFNQPAVMASTKCRHLDLHTAIRGSCHEQFALLPYQAREYAADFLQWLEDSNIDALVFHNTAGGTFSHFTSEYFNADSCTLEIGKALPFGQNDLARFSNMTAALQDLIAGRFSIKRDKPALKRYRVVDAIIKQHESFQLNIPEDTKNFTELPQGLAIAHQQNQSWKITSPANFILFPNAHVAIGLRAGLLLEKYCC
ncbi:succinylglutamate desuccinylase [Xenorhabdus sp. DI]|uniref:succinylglutamate desuccinylase n=1 Tax=Xenorhabdus doucetiae TaxID=351671 RepID=UPI0019C07C00|nr:MULTISPECIES: succinylglutamate desuccinylase [unclassified Xenorhabdus]MBD2784454.1 succinylglutamate desuccinylase [Xenorhabdus sp. 3]MBD2789286.1 succinylglutamate desuccinylase [Xenorhabdus sp. DI]